MRRCSSTDSREAQATTASTEAESIGWIALGAYLHDDNATEVLVLLVGDAVLLVI